MLTESGIGGYSASDAEKKIIALDNSNKFLRKALEKEKAKDVPTSSTGKRVMDIDAEITAAREDNVALFEHNKRMKAQLREVQRENQELVLERNQLRARVYALEQGPP